MFDPEIEAMGQVATALDALTDDARVRVVRWAADRYGAAITAATPARNGLVRVGGFEPALEDRPSRAPEAREAAEPTFEHFVDLFDAVDPKSDIDKALTAAYWLQVVSKQGS